MMTDRVPESFFNFEKKKSFISLFDHSTSLLFSVLNIRQLLENGVIESFVVICPRKKHNDIRQMLERKGIGNPPRFLDPKDLVSKESKKEVANTDLALIPYADRYAFGESPEETLIVQNIINQVPRCFAVLSNPFKMIQLRMQANED